MEASDIIEHEIWPSRPPESPKKARPATKHEQSDRQWLEDLGLSPAYLGIDIQREFEKMRVWASTYNQQPTRRRFVAWLNKVERPIQPGATPKKVFSPYDDPPLGWKEALSRIAPEYAGQSWEMVRVPFGKRIWQACA